MTTSIKMKVKSQPSVRKVVEQSKTKIGKPHLCEVCNEDPLFYAQSGLCKKCYAFLYYWNNRSVTDKMRHVKKLERWDARAHIMLVGGSKRTK